MTEGAMAKKVSIDILGHSYAIRTDGDEEHIRRIANYVNLKSREVMEATHTVSTVDLFIKVAMNLADELLQERAAREALYLSIEEEARNLILQIDAHMGGNPKVS